MTRTQSIILYSTLLALGAATAIVALRTPPAAAEDTVITVYKSPTCGCCAAWVDYMREAGFNVTVEDVTDLHAVKARHGVPRQLESCHTAIAEGYVVEGHVPADLVTRLLAERPADAWGIAVPGMPAGSPGMEQGDRREPYDVILYNARTGGATIYASR
ncbi:MAG: DUF411 domain-containing protein [Gemmatimonadales bacterium]